MINWLKYRLAVTRAVKLREAKEIKNTSQITKEEKDFRDFYEAELDKGTRVHDDAGVFGREGRRDRDINILRGEITKTKRDVAEIHTIYLLNKVDRLGIPLPDINNPKLWLAKREQYSREDGHHEIDTRELLSVSGLHEVRASIRKEQKERFEPWKDRSGFIFGAAGLLIAVLTITLRIIEVAASHPTPAPSSLPAREQPAAIPVPSPSPAPSSLPAREQPTAIPVPSPSPAPPLPAVPVEPR
jgi:hypothetical protein